MLVKRGEEFLYLLTNVFELWLEGKEGLEEMC